MSAHKPRAPAPLSGEAWGILNPFGDFWTYQTFSSEAWARQYIKDFWAGNKNKPDLATFTPVPVTVTVTAIEDTSRANDPLREAI